MSFFPSVNFWGNLFVNDWWPIQYDSASLSSVYSALRAWVSWSYLHIYTYWVEGTLVFYILYVLEIYVCVTTFISHACSTPFYCHCHIYMHTCTLFVCMTTFISHTCNTPFCCHCHIYTHTCTLFVCMATFISHARNTPFCCHWLRQKLTLRPGGKVLRPDPVQK